MSNGPYLPIDADAEAAVLAALLTSPEAFLDISTELTPDDFGIGAHQALYRAALACDAAGKPIDAITVADELRRAKSLVKAGGTDGIAAVIARAADVANVAAHTAIVADKSRLRRLLTAGRAITADALDPEADSSTVLTAAEERVFEIGRTRGASSMLDMTQAVPKMLADLARARTSVLIGQPTGLPDLDRLTGGLQGGQLIILAARPAMGKSALATSMATHIAAATGKAVPLLSYEMSVSEITMRMLASELRYNLHRLRQGDIPSGMEDDLAAAAEKLRRSTVLIDDNPPETIGGVRSAMRRLAARQPVGAIFVDYLQLLSGDGRRKDENRTQEISDISRGLKRLATELDVPVIALSQLNRGLEQRPNKRPVLSDLRDSGSLEQDASVVMFLFREHVYNAAVDPTSAELLIAKQRNGPIGTVPLHFSGDSATFSAGHSVHTPPPAMAGTSGGHPSGSFGGGRGRRADSPF